MRKLTLSAAVLAMAASSVSFGQTVTSSLVENFDDGLGADRWDFLARENGLDPAAGTPDGGVNFGFNYGSANYTRYFGNAPGALTNAQEAIGSAPGGGGTTGVVIRVNDGLGSATANAIAQAAITPKGFVNTGDYRMTLDMFANNSNPDATGSSELSLIGLNGDGTTASPVTQVVGDNLPTGSTTPAILANQTATGYAFASATEGGFTGDYRVYSRRAPGGDDGPLFAKRNATWTGTTSGPIFNDDGTYAGFGTNSVESFNNYYKDISPGRKNSDFYTGGIGKSWLQVGVEQRGRIVTYTLGGKIINTLFLANSIGGKVSLGAYDAAASTPGDVTESYFLFDNVRVDQLASAGTNVIVPSDNYARFTGGAVASNGAATLNYLELDTANADLGGTGTLTLGTPAGAIYAGGAGLSHTISKPLNVNADTSVFVDETATLNITNASYGTGVDFHKTGRGALTVNTVRARSLTIASGRVNVPTGASKVELITFGYGGNTVNTARLDVGKSLFAVDYSNAPLTATPPATVEPLSPFVRLAGLVNGGFAPDAEGNPQFNGAGIVTSAPELQGAGYGTGSFAIRAVEASTLGYADGATLGTTGLTIDATTVLFGVSFKADSNFDHRVSFPDLVVLAQNYNPAFEPDFTSTDPSAPNFPRQFFQGDATGNGKVDFADLVLLAQSYGLNLSGTGALASAAQFSADWALAQSMVPEPTTLAVLGLGGLVAARRRRA